MMERIPNDQVQMIVKVYTSQNPQTCVDCPITPETTCKDVVAICKEPGEVNCHLAELWRECERPIGEEEHIYDILQQWGVHRNEVKFYLRHESANMADINKDAGHKPKKKMLNGDGTMADYKQHFPGSNNVDLSLTDLQDMATRQQQQIETQQQMLVAKQQRLKFLKQQEMKHQQIAQENERLRRLRDKVELQEQKLRKLRALRGKVDTTKTANNNISTELDAVKGLFAEKEKELLAAVAKVEELSHQLEDLKKGNMNGLNGGGYVYQSPASLQLDKLRQELLRRNKLNENQSITLQNQRLTLSTRKDEMAAIDQRIEELTDQLRNKRSLQNLHRAPPLIPNNNNNNVTVPNGTLQNQKNDSYRGGPSPLIETNGVTANRHHDIKSFPNGDVHSYANNQKKQGPPAPPKPQLMMKPGFKPRSANKGSVSAPQGGPVTAQHPRQDGSDQVKHNGTTNGSSNKPELVNENSGSDTSSLTENSSVESIPVSGLPPQPIPTSTVQGKPVIKSNTIESNRRSSPVQTRVSPVPQKGSPVQSKSSSPVPQNHRNSPVPRGSPIPQQLRGSPVPSTQRGSPVQRSSPVPHNPPRVLPGAMNDPSATLLHARQARNRTPIYNPDDLAMLSPPAPPSPNGSSNSSGSHFEIDDSIKSGHSNNGMGAPQKGRLPSYSGPTSTGNRNGRVPGSPDQNRAPVGPNQQHPSSPQRKRQPPPAPPRTSTLNYTSSHPPSPTRSGVPQRMSSTSSEPINSNGSSQYNNGRDPSPMTVNGPPGSPSRGPPQSPTRGGLPRTGIPYSHGHAPSGYGPNPSYSTAPSNTNPNAPPRPQLPYDYNGETDPTRPIHQRSPATVGMYAPPPNAQQRNYNHPSYQQNHMGGPGQQHPRSQNFFPASRVGYPTDEQDSPRPSSPTNKLPIMNLYRNIDLERFHNMPRPLKKRLSYSEDKESLNFLNLGSSTDNKFDNLTLDKKNESKDNGSHSGNHPPMPRIIETSLMGNNSFNIKNTLSPDVNTNTKPSISNGKTTGIAIPHKPNDGSQLSKPTGSGKPLSASDIGEVKGILKRKPNGREHIRVRFDPLALLLDASLEGEFELVQRIIPEVRNPSGANDEGITALHNAICASHYQIVNFLILKGVDVNSPDSDGWTPLHCAASCNNLIMVRNLVEHGAALFATTISDKESPAEKCEEEEDGYIQCSEYLYGAQEKTGTANNGLVHALYSYEAEQPDELSFKDGDELTILRKGDEEETQWWWARRHDKEGYVPRNLIGFYSRVKPLFR